MWDAFGLQILLNRRCRCLASTLDIHFIVQTATRLRVRNWVEHGCLFLVIGLWEYLAGEGGWIFLTVQLMALVMKVKLDTVVFRPTMENLAL